MFLGSIRNAIECCGYLHYFALLDALLLIYSKTEILMMDHIQHFFVPSWTQNWKAMSVKVQMVILSHVDPNSLVNRVIFLQIYHLINSCFYLTMVLSVDCCIRVLFRHFLIVSLKPLDAVLWLQCHVQMPASLSVLCDHDVMRW